MNSLARLAILISGGSIAQLSNGGNASAFDGLNRAYTAANQRAYVQFAGGTGGNPDLPIDPNAHVIGDASSALKAADIERLMTWIKAPANSPPGSPIGEGTGPSPDKDPDVRLLVGKLQRYKTFLLANPSDKSFKPLPKGIFSGLRTSGMGDEPESGGGGTGGSSEWAMAKAKIDSWMFHNPLPQGPGTSGSPR
jgi:hypothetical protein